MKPIEETHPSLKYINFFEACSGFNEVGEENNESDYIVGVIQKHTIDKQVLIKAIDNVFDVNDHEDKVHNERMKKELGLFKCPMCDSTTERQAFNKDYCAECEYNIFMEDDEL